MHIWGNERAMALIQRLAQREKMPHALIIEGMEGSGKKTLARFVAATRLCRAGSSKPCLSCEPCRKSLKDIHPDVMWYTVPPGKRDFPVANVREIAENLQIAPSEGACKVYVLDKAHTMNANSQNALLKMLEEPPSFAAFILLTENSREMLDTVRSRARTISLRSPTVEQCHQALAEKFPHQDSSLLLAAAQGAGGNVGRAMTLLEEAKPSRAAAQSQKLLSQLVALDAFGALSLLAHYDKERQALLEMLWLLHRGLGETAFKGSSPEGKTIPSMRVVQAVAAAQEAIDFIAANGHIPLACARMTEQILKALGG